MFMLYNTYIYVHTYIYVKYIYRHILIRSLNIGSIASLEHTIHDLGLSLILVMTGN